MAYGHAERNLALIRQLEAETKQLLGTEAQPDPGPSAWMLGASPTSSPADDQANRRLPSGIISVPRCRDRAGP
jgi:hypothetical protein